MTLIGMRYSVQIRADVVVFVEASDNEKMNGKRYEGFMIGIRCVDQEIHFVEGEVGIYI